MNKPGKQIIIFCVLLTTLVFLMSQDESVKDWWRRGCPPHPYIMPASVAAWRLTTVPTDDQFTHTFYYGEECGKRLGLAGAAERGKAVPKNLRYHFFDGVGHGYAPPEGIHQTVEEIERYIPDKYMLSVHDGVLRHYTMVNIGDPELVVPFAKNYLRVSGLPEPYNGVRIGLQRSLGDNLPQALQVASSFPEDYWPALFEELGWRASRHKPKRDSESPERLLEDDRYWEEAMLWVEDHAQYVPESALCHYIHGAARGRALGYPWQDRFGWIRIQDEIHGFDTRCQDAAYQGIGWAIFIQTGHRSNRTKLMMESITDDVGRSIAAQTLDQIEASLNTEGAEPLNLWDLDGVKLKETETADPKETPR